MPGGQTHIPVLESGHVSSHAVQSSLGAGVAGGQVSSGAGVMGAQVSSTGSVQQTSAPGFALFPGAQQGVLHIVCPSGHVLETPREMIGEDAICPFCHVQFRLRYENSLEYRKQRQAERERRELERGKAWMQWAFAIAAVVVLGVILLFAASASR